MRKINAEEVTSLYNFTQKHFVEHYDLQTELVDHLAQGIEQTWEKNPTISFDEALSAEFKKFGIFGFSDVVEARRMALSKKYNQIVWKHFLEFFSWPKILSTGTGILLAILTLKQIDFSREIIVATSFAMGVFMFVQIQKNKKKFSKKLKENPKKWLFEEIVFQYGDWLFFASLPMQFILHIPDEIFYNSFVLSAIVAFMATFLLLTVVMVTIIPKKSEEYLNETYPEYKFSK